MSGKTYVVASPWGIVAITPNDNADVPGGSCRGFEVTVDGDVAVVMADGSIGVLPARTAGVQYPYQITRVLATGTTATGIIGLR